MTPPDDGGHGEDPLIVLVRAVGRLEGLVTGNFETLFRNQRHHESEMTRVAGDVSKVRERLAKLEARPSVRLVPRKRVTAAKWGAIAVGIVTILGGISSAVHEGARILHALIQALDGK